MGLVHCNINVQILKSTLYGEFCDTYSFTHTLRHTLALCLSHYDTHSPSLSLMQCENILFASREVDPELKIADFGLAQLLQRGDKLMAGACKLNPKT